MIKDGFDENQAHTLLTAIGNLSMTISLGDGHTIDVSDIEGVECEVVKLKLYSQVEIDGEMFGIYRCRAL